MAGQASGIPANGKAMGVGPPARHPALPKATLKRSSGRSTPAAAKSKFVPTSRYTSQSLRMASILYPGSGLEMGGGPYESGELGFPKQKKKEELGATAPTGAGTIA